MKSIASLCWTSRTEVCNRLVQFLRGTSPSLPVSGAPDGCRRRTQRYQVARLLARLGGVHYAWKVRELLIDNREEFPIRVEALMWLAERRLPHSSESLEQLLADPELRQEANWFNFDHQFFPLCIDEEGQAIALRYLESMSPEQR